MLRLVSNLLVMEAHQVCAVDLNVFYSDLRDALRDQGGWSERQVDERLVMGDKSSMASADFLGASPSTLFRRTGPGKLFGQDVFFKSIFSYSESFSIFREMRAGAETVVRFRNEIVTQMVAGDGAGVAPVMKAFLIPGGCRSIALFKDHLPQLWLVMERYIGEDVFDLIERMNQPPRRYEFRQGIELERAKRMALSMLVGLASMHRLDRVHGDVKPENFIQVSADADPDDVRLINLKAHATVDYSRRDGSYYLAPELFSRHHNGSGHISRCNRYEVGSEVDMWAFGMTIFQMIEGSNFWSKAFQGLFTGDYMWRPHREDDGTPFPSEEQVLLFFRLKSQPGVSDILNRVRDPFFRGLLTKLLVVDPAQRLSAEAALLEVAVELGVVKKREEGVEWLMRARQQDKEALALAHRNLLKKSEDCVDVASKITVPLPRCMLPGDENCAAGVFWRNIALRKCPQEQKDLKEVYKTRKLEEAAGFRKLFMIDVELTENEVAKHTEEDDCWIIIDGQVYDVTEYVRDTRASHNTASGKGHPGAGGALVILNFCGKDASEEFNLIHAPSVLATLPECALLGPKDGSHRLEAKQYEMMKHGKK